MPGLMHAQHAVHALHHAAGTHRATQDLRNPLIGSLPVWLETAVQDLPGARWAKFRRMALDPRALTFLDRLQRELLAAEPRADLRAALVKLWQVRHPHRLSKGTTVTGKRDPVRVAVHTLICQQLEFPLGPETGVH